MKRLAEQADHFYRRNPLAFALVWIGAYVVLLSAADALSESIGMRKSVTAAVCIAMAALLLMWIRQSGRTAYFGLQRPNICASRMLYYAPLALIVSVNLWHGCTMTIAAHETALYVISMLFVGVLEEIIFRGLLFRAMAKDNLRAAVIVSGVTFGMGHIVNLLGGAPVVQTLLQIVYAAAAGLLFTVIFMRTGSIIPCIVCHSALNMLGAFAGESALTLQDHIVSAAVLTAVAAAYAAYILKKTKPCALPGD